MQRNTHAVFLCPVNDRFQGIESAARCRRRHDGRQLAVESGILPAMNQNHQLIHTVAMVRIKQVAEFVEMAVPVFHHHPGSKFFPIG